MLLRDSPTTDRSRRSPTWGKAVENPVKKVKFFPENNRNLRYLSVKEMKLLIEAASEHLKPILITALNTGMRKSEILKLKWRQIDFERKVIHVLDSKNTESRDIPINELLTDTFITHKLISEGEFVFGHPDGRPRVNIEYAFRGAVKRAGIEHCRFHDLKHTFASHLVMAGVDLMTVKELLGHKTIKMTMRYSHLSQDHKRKAVEKLIPHNFSTMGNITELKKVVTR